MNVVVIGAGVIGVTTAWFLRQQGFDVTVLERQSGPALETSRANAGQLSYGYAMPWAAPGMPLKALKWLCDPLAPFKLRLDSAHPLRQAEWLARMFWQCDERRFERNKARMLALSRFSKESLAELRAALPSLDFDHQAKGTLQLFRTRDQYEAGKRDLERLLRSGVKAKLIDDDLELRRREPGLVSSVDLWGGLLLEDDETGDCHQFTRQLAQQAEAAGVRFVWGTEFKNWLMTAGGDVGGVLTSSGAYVADRFIVCAGSYSPFLLAPLGLNLPVYPVKGYSLTMDILRPDRAPLSTVMDEQFKVAITRMGSRLRIGGTAELAGYDHQLREARKAVLRRSAQELFPEAGDFEKTEFWTGLRPTTPDSVPYVGPVIDSAVWLNCGHGTLGWTMACGSARALALSLAGKARELPPGLLRPFG